MSLNLIAPSGRTVARALPESHGPIIDRGRTIGRFAHRRGDPNNGDNQALLVVDPLLSERGRWRAEIEALAVKDGNYHVWIERDEVVPGSQSRIARKDAVATTTTGTICNGHHTISVGAYDSATGSQAWFSSVGPTRDGRDKPDLLAPGVGVVAARSAPEDDLGDEHGLLTQKSGTSMASPHVAGAVAVLYEAAGRALSASEVRRMLLDSARKIDGKGPPLLDVRAAVELAKRALPSVKAEKLPEDVTVAERATLHDALTPDLIFDAFTVPARAGLQLSLPALEVVAYAGARPHVPIEAGDWLIERALGEGGVASARVIDERWQERAVKPASNRLVVRRQKRERRFTPRGAGLFVPHAPRSWIGGGSAPRSRLALAAVAQAPRTRRTAQPKRAEAIGGFLDRPPKGTLAVGRYGLSLRVDPELAFVAGVDKGEQAIAMYLVALVGGAYSPLLAEEFRDAVILKGLGQLAGIAKEGELIAGERGEIGTDSARLGLAMVRWLRDVKRLALDPKQLDDARGRRLEHACAVEDAWLEVFEHTQGAGKLGRSFDTSIWPTVRRYYWVDRTLFTNIVWSLGSLVEQARSAMLAFEAKPTSKYGDPPYDDRIRAIGDLWNKFNEGADALDAVRADSALERHPGRAYVFPSDPQIASEPARVRFIEYCLALAPALAKRAREPKNTKARRELLDGFAADYKIIVDLHTAGGGGEDELRAEISRANADPFPCSLAISPRETILPAGAELAAEMSVNADHWTSLWSYNYWWDLLRVDDPRGPLRETSTSGFTMLGRRLDRQLEYTQTDYQRLKRELEEYCGPAGVGAQYIAGSLAVIRMVGTVLKDVLRAVFEKPYEKSLVLPGPGIYLLRCVAGNSDSKGPLYRVPSAAYQLLFVVSAQKLSSAKADAALQGMRQNLLEKALLEAAIAAGTLSGDELERATQNVALIEADLSGDASRLYALQRANLERAKSDESLARQVSDDPSYAQKKITERISEIDTITTERARRLRDEAKATSAPYRVIAILVTDLGPTLQLMIEVVDMPAGDGEADVFVLDSTTKRSGFERIKRPTRLQAIRDALFDLLESDVTGYGRGWCTILVPKSGATSFGEHDKASFRVDKSPVALFNELVEGGSLIISVLALLAAPFTGGASLVILIPTGIIGMIPSGYRLAKRRAEGTFAWDMDTAMDLLNITSGFLGVSQTGSAALKFSRLSKAFQLTGHGSDGLGIVMGTAQFFDELEAIAKDASRLPSEKRFAMAMAIANKLLNDGVMVGHMMAMRTYGDMMQRGVDPTKYPLPPDVLPDTYQLPAIHERAIPSKLMPASEELRTRVKALAKRDVLVLVDPDLGMGAEVRYVLDAFGFISDIYLTLGPRAGEAQLPSHAATARELFKFTGVLGKARTLISWARAFISKNPEHKVGKTRAWEARRELEKLPQQITDYMRSVGAELAEGKRTPTDVDLYIRGLFEQLEVHEAALKDASPALGKIAAHDASQQLTPRQQWMRDGKQHAHIVTGIPLDRIDVRDGPKTQEYVSVRRNGQRLELVVPDKIKGFPLHPDDIVDAIEAHRNLHDQRPATFPAPDPTKPWTADQEASYQGLPEAEAGYRWELASDGSLAYVANRPEFPGRVYDAAQGAMARDPTSPVRPREPPPGELGPKYSDDEVIGFYQGAVDPTSDVPGFNTDDKREPTANRIVMTTELDVGAQYALARIVNTYYPKLAELSLDAHFFNEDLPSRVATNPPLLADGTPTSILVTVRQMRRESIPRGGLRRLRLHQIQNVLTVLQVHLALKQLNTTLDVPLSAELSRQLQGTALGGYARTIARQSGHAIVGVELGGGRTSVALSDLMDWYQNRMGPLAKSAEVGKLHDAYLDPSSTYKNGKFSALAQKLRAAGVTRNTQVVTDFDIILLLEDAP
jgi:hypothetical protein